jgi:serine/threonine protein kinase
MSVGRVIKKTNDIICIEYMSENNIWYFAKMFVLKQCPKTKEYKLRDSVIEEYNREIEMNRYIEKHLKDKSYYVKMIDVSEKTIPPIEIVNIVKSGALYNILTFEHAGNHTLRYYINRLSSRNFKQVIYHLKQATTLLQDIDVIHYDLYPQTNVIVKKERGQWIVKIIDFGLAYLDKTDKDNSDFKLCIENVKLFNTKQTIDDDNDEDELN